MDLMGQSELIGQVGAISTFHYYTTNFFSPFKQS